MRCAATHVCKLISSRGLGGAVRRVWKSVRVSPGHCMAVPHQSSRPALGMSTEAEEEEMMWGGPFF